MHFILYLQPKLIKPLSTVKAPTSLKKKNEHSFPKVKNESTNELIKSQEVEIR